MQEPHTKVFFALEHDADDHPPASVESVWALPGAASDEFVLDSVPFFISVATLGDCVLTRLKDLHRWFERVVDRSRNSLIRVVFFEKSELARVDAHLQTHGCATEYLSAHSLLAVSVPETSSLLEVQAFLAAEAAKDLLDYEEPLLRQ